MLTDLQILENIQAVQRIQNLDQSSGLVKTIQRNFLRSKSMKKEIIRQLNKTFEGSAYTQNDTEYWMARELQKLLDYTQWRNFLQVIDKAKTACLNSKQNISDHFANLSKTIPMPKWASKEIDDIMLTRYACYLIAQNGIKVTDTFNHSMFDKIVFFNRISTQ
jgi:hypothetical protein